MLEEITNSNVRPVPLEISSGHDAGRTPSYEEKKERKRMSACARSKKWRAKNAERVKAQNKKWRIANPEKAKAGQKRWRTENTEKAKMGQKKYCAENPAKEKARYKKYRDENRDKVRAASKKHYDSNPDKQRERVKRYHAANPDKVRQNSHIRRARKIGALVGSPTRILDWAKSIRESKQVACYWCGLRFIGKKAHLDHIVALTKGGAHSIENLCISCPRCNQSKHAKTLEQWNKTLTQPVLL